MIVAGIDPGKGGGIAVINEIGHCETILMPLTEEGNVDGCGVMRFLAERDAEFAVIEQVHSMPTDAKPRAFSFGFVTGQVHTCGQLLGTEPRAVSPQKWKRAWGLIKTDKSASRAKAIEVFPLAAEQFKRVKDTGRAEAALIAAFHLSMHRRDE